MNPLRLKISRVMVVVAILALEFGVIKALLAESEDEFLFVDFPTVNLLLVAVFVAIRKPRARSFVLGFVVAGTLSLLAFHAWAHAHPWTFLRYFTPPFEALDRRLVGLWPDAHNIMVYAILVVVFALPHAILGL